MSTTENQSKDVALDVAVWNRYWADGRLAACSGDQDQQYFLVIQDLWREFFSGLFNDAAVLDLATGNGAVLDLARQQAQQLDYPVHLHGVDQARVTSDPLLARCNAAGISIEMHGETRIEQLPFDAGGFDFVSSQFGIEYSKLDLTVPEVARVTKPGGLLMVIAHTADSGILAQTDQDLADFEMIETGTGITRLFGELLASEEHDGSLDPGLKSSPRYVACKDRFNQAAAKVMAQLRGRPPGSIHFLNGLMTSMGEIYQHRHQHPLATVQERCQTLQMEIQAHVRRLRQMQAAALDQAGLEAFTVRLVENNFLIRVDEAVVDENGHKLGHRWVARKSKPEDQ